MPTKIMPHDFLSLPLSLRPSHLSTLGATDEHDTPILRHSADPFLVWGPWTSTTLLKLSV